jgi:hypothetical protein
MVVNLAAVIIRFLLASLIIVKVNVFILFCRLFSVLLLLLVVRLVVPRPRLPLSLIVVSVVIAAVVVAALLIVTSLVVVVVSWVLLHAPTVR